MKTVIRKQNNKICIQNTLILLFSLLLMLITRIDEVKSSSVLLLEICPDPGSSLDNANKKLPSQYEDLIVDYYQGDLVNIIFPGTKWCGPGDIADDDDDLGEEKEADKCCRTHDFCEDYIPAGGSKHGLINTGKYSKLHCKCDCAFKKCLKEAQKQSSSLAAGLIGKIYFKWVPTKCFMKTHPIKKCVQLSSFPHFRCLIYELDESQEEIYQFFDVPPY